MAGADHASFVSPSRGRFQEHQSGCECESPRARSEGQKVIAQTVPGGTPVSTQPWRGVPHMRATAGGRQHRVPEVLIPGHARHDPALRGVPGAFMCRVRCWAA